jgi:multimeric flavodoxin WrbA
MNEQKEIVLLVGSPRAERSTSLTLGKYLCEQIDPSEDSFKVGFIHRLMMRKERQDQIIKMVNQANLIIFSFPLYIDHLPSPVIRMMEFLYGNKESLFNPEDKKFVAISNCGFPEAHQIDLAIEICHNFSDAMKFQWRGGLKKGGGEMINKYDLNEMGKRVEDVKKGLELAAEALKRDQEIPDDAKELVAKLVIPVKMYKKMGNLGWRLRGLGNFNIFNLKNKPYKE